MLSFKKNKHHPKRNSSGHPNLIKAFMALKDMNVDTQSAKKGIFEAHAGNYESAIEHFCDRNPNTVCCACDFELGVDVYQETNGLSLKHTRK
jgi:hypothetical protein